jgi:uncharacterized cupredoxin-like copper-binding protein
MRCRLVPLLCVFALALAVLGSAFAQHSHPDEAKPQAAKETAFGRSADARKASRTVLVEMSDTNQFVPAEITVRKGEVIRFVAVNAGIEMHEMVLGTMAELKAHAAAMKKNRDMHHHDAPNITHVAPGNSGVLAWQFTRPGEFYYGCLVDDHFERGMVGRIRVE